MERQHFEVQASGFKSYHYYKVLTVTTSYNIHNTKLLPTHTASDVIMLDEELVDVAR